MAVVDVAGVDDPSAEARHPVAVVHPDVLARRDHVLDLFAARAALLVHRLDVDGPLAALRFRLFDREIVFCCLFDGPLDPQCLFLDVKIGPAKRQRFATAGPR